jgi:DNA polymerase-4
VNQKFGKNSVYLAGMEKARNTADEKIAFNKTWLFSEGKGDNVV